MPLNSVLDFFDIAGIPLFNQDHEINMPKQVKDFKLKIRESDAILIATPEYNYSVPGYEKMLLTGHQDHMEITLLMKNLLL